MTYALVNAARTAILSVGGRPDWTIDGEPASDAVLAAGGFAVDESGEPVLDGDGQPVLATDLDGWLPVVQAEIVGADDLLNTLAWNEQSDWLIDGDCVIQTYTITARTLLEVKSLAASQIDSAAESTRSAFVTQGTGQALEYEETRKEVEHWKAAEDPNISEYPMIRAEWNARKVADPDITPGEVVLEIEGEYQIWRVVGSAIKEIRRTAKIAAELAETPAGVRHAFDWAMTAYGQAAMTGTFDPLT